MICSLCTHPQHHEIDLALINGNGSVRDIAGRFGTNKSTVDRHKRKCLRKGLGNAIKEGRIALAEDVQSQVEDLKLEAYGFDLRRELARMFERANKFSDAADESLQDPNDPDKYDLRSWRAEDTTVVYSITEGEGKTVHKKELLSTLIDRLMSKLPSAEVERVETRRMDGRKFILDALARLQAQTELVAKLAGLLGAENKSNVTVNNYNTTDARVLNYVRMWMVDCNGSWSEAKHYLAPGIPEIYSLPPEPPPGFLDKVEAERRKAVPNSVMSFGSRETF
jgi:hypothetical protein